MRARTQSHVQDGEKLGSNRTWTTDNAQDNAAAQAGKIRCITRQTSPDHFSNMLCTWTTLLASGSTLNRFNFKPTKSPRMPVHQVSLLLCTHQLRNGVWVGSCSSPSFLFCCTRRRIFKPLFGWNPLARQHQEPHNLDDKTRHGRGAASQRASLQHIRFFDAYRRRIAKLGSSARRELRWAASLQLWVSAILRGLWYD